MDLLLNLRPDLGRQAAIEQAVREAIVDGQLGPGTALPSTRSLAAELGVARGTVVAAIDQLAAEGLLETRPGSSTRVAHVPPAVVDDPPPPSGPPGSPRSLRPPGRSGSSGSSGASGPPGPSGPLGQPPSARGAVGVDESRPPGGPPPRPAPSGPPGRPSSDRQAAGTTGPIGTARAPTTPPAPGTRADFWSGDPDLTLFPRSAWSAAVRSALESAEAATLGYGDPRGTAALRAALAEYLARTRGVVVSPERTLITAGYTHTLAVLGRMLAGLDRRPVVVEDPSFWRHRELLAAAGLRDTAVVVDDDGIRTDDLAATGAGAAFVTPGHHTPLGVSLSPPRRAALVRWAAAGDAVVVEDDYDGELRYDRRPLRAVQALDPARVVYCGSTSKSLAPGLRLSWCVLPPPLLGPALQAMGAMGGTAVSVVEQLALAELLRSGRYDRQVRRIRGEYRRRRDLLVAALAEHVPAVRVEGVDAGLKALLRLPPGSDELAVVDRLAERSVAVAPLTAFQVNEAPSPAGPAIVVNYGRPYGHGYRSALDRLVGGLGAALDPAG